MKEPLHCPQCGKQTLPDQLRCDCGYQLIPMATLLANMQRTAIETASEILGPPVSSADELRGFITSIEDQQAAQRASTKSETVPPSGSPTLPSEGAR